MKPKLKLKLVVVLSASMLLNVFLIWELKRVKDHTNQLEEVIRQQSGK
tara:strand:+ start:322 stop:465 length:144 start_codon:yes stop_codon:yes gene_type:complete